MLQNLPVSDDDLVRVYIPLFQIQAKAHDHYLARAERGPGLELFDPSGLYLGDRTVLIIDLVSPWSLLTPILTIGASKLGKTLEVKNDAVSVSGYVLDSQIEFDALAFDAALPVDRGAQQDLTSLLEEFRTVLLERGLAGLDVDSRKFVRDGNRRLSASTKGVHAKPT